MTDIDSKIAKFDDMLDKDAGRYSFARAIAAVTGKAPLNGIEREVHQEIGRIVGPNLRANRPGERSVFVPWNAPMAVGRYMRGMTVGNAGVFANSVTPWASALRSSMVTAKLGAAFLPGLQGTTTAPRINGGASAAWLGESSPGSDGSYTLSGEIISPKRLCGWVDFTRSLLASGPAVYDQLAADLTSAMAHALDAAALAGPGGNAPTVS